MKPDRMQSFTQSYAYDLQQPALCSLYTNSNFRNEHILLRIAALCSVVTPPAEACAVTISVAHTV